MKLIHNTIWTIVILLIMNNAIAQVAHETGNHDVIWFSTSTSTLLNRSSTALATQHIRRGLRLAAQALQGKLGTSDKLIANHNLCVGFLSTSDYDSAKLYCVRATELSQQPFTIVKRRGAFFMTDTVIAENTLPKYTLLQTLMSNMEQHNSHMRLSLLK
jgi:hypothetical protein